MPLSQTVLEFCSRRGPVRSDFAKGFGVKFVRLLLRYIERDDIQREATNSIEQLNISIQNIHSKRAKEESNITKTTLVFLRLSHRIPLKIHPHPIRRSPRWRPPPRHIRRHSARMGVHHTHPSRPRIEPSRRPSSHPIHPTWSWPSSRPWPIVRVPRAARRWWPSVMSRWTFTSPMW